jgi:hypothetical protein
MDEFLILIMEPEWDSETVTQADWDREMLLHNAFTKAVRDAGGEVRGGDALKGNAAAARVRPGKGDAATIVTDGPFMETKELLSGYYLITAKDMDEAKRLAALCPTGGYLEVHPIFDVSTMTSGE